MTSDESPSPAGEEQPPELGPEDPRPAGDGASALPGADVGPEPAAPAGPTPVGEVTARTPAHRAGAGPAAPADDTGQPHSAAAETTAGEPALGIAALDDASHPAAGEAPDSPGDADTAPRPAAPAGVPADDTRTGETEAAAVGTPPAAGEAPEPPGDADTAPRPGRAETAGQAPGGESHAEDGPAATAAPHGAPAHAVGEERGHPVDTAAVHEPVRGEDGTAEPVAVADGRRHAPGVRASAERPPAEDATLADPARLRAAVEAVLLIVDTVTSALALAQGLGRPLADVDNALRELQAEYDAGARGLDLREVAGGWRLYTREELAPYVERFVLDGQQARLTQAALETLAVVAYRQPVTRSRVSAIRGVNVDGVMRTLLSRGLVEECGADPETGGGLYRTTSFFLEKMGLTSLLELPSLAPLLPDTSQLDDVGLST